jgi:hypothetical protein
MLDQESAIPPTGKAYVRRIAGCNLWLWYRVDDSGDVVVVTLTTQPPVPLEP